MPKANLTIEGTTPVDADARYDARYISKDDLWVDPTDPAYGMVSGLSPSDSAGIAANTAALQAALNDLPNFVGYTGGARLHLPPGDFMIDASQTRLWPSGLTDLEISGGGKHVTWITLKDGANVPNIDVTATDAYQDRLYVHDIGFRTLDPTSHASAPPLWSIRRGYLSIFERVSFWKPSGVAVYYEGQTATGQANIGDVPTFRNCQFAKGGTGTDHLLHLYNVNNYIVDACDFENCGPGKAGLFDDGSYRAHLWHHGRIINCHFENNPGPAGSSYGYGIYLSRAWGVSIMGNWFDDSNVYLDEESFGNWVDENEFGGTGEIIDAGDNYIGPNDGKYNPKPGRVSVYIPSSWTSDPDESSRSPTQFRTGQNYNGGTGSLAKNFYRAATPTLEHHFGRTPLAIAPNTANGYSSIENFPVVAGADAWLDVRFWPEGNPGAVRVLLQDAAGPTTFHDSQPLSRTYAPDVTEYRAYRYQAVVRVPSGVTTCRVLIASENVNRVWVESCKLIPNGILNGGMEAPSGYPYAGGVAAGWTGSGTGTPSQETTIVKSPGSAQKIVCAAGQSYFISQSPTIDSNRFYYLQAYLRVDVGLPTRMVAAWGDDATSTILSQFTISPQENGVYRAVTKIVRPSSFASLKIGITSDATLPATGYADHVIWVPLKEDATEHTAMSQPIDLAAASSPQIVIPPQIGMRLRRLRVVALSATTAGTTVRVGKFGTGKETYYASWASSVLTPPAEVELPLSKTDLRAGDPLVVDLAAGGTATGRIQLVGDYD